MPGVALGALRGDLTMPSEWEMVGRVEKLYIYPVKSLAHVEVSEMSIGEFAGYSGSYTDRQFMVTDIKGKFVTSRRYPNMSLIQPKISGDTIELSYPGKTSIRVKISSAGDKKQCDVWGDPCTGVDQGDEAGKWLSEVILQKEEGLRLVCHEKGASSRPDRAQDAYLTPLIKVGDKPYFADGMPYLLLSSASISGLNNKLKEANEPLTVEETRFRPNIFIDGEFPPFAEDAWTFIRIGDAVFRNVKPCTRCNFTTVNPATGEKDKKGQPLKVLREFRSSEDSTEKKAYGTSPFFGINLGAEVLGTVKAGQPVWIRKSEAEKLKSAN